MYLNYLKITLRNLRRNLGYSAINISGLSIGIACCLLILMYVRHEFSYDNFHENADRIVRVSLETGDQSLAITPSLIAPSLGQIAPEIDKWVRVFEPTRHGPVVINTESTQIMEESFFYADSTFFDIFSFEFIHGNPKTALQNPRSLVLPRSTAEKLFGTSDAIGEVVHTRIFGNEYDFVITGVIEEIPSNSHFSFDYLASLNTIQSWSQLDDTQLQGYNFYTYFLLKNIESLITLETTAAMFVNNHFPEDRISGLSFIPLTDLYLKSALEFEIRPMGSIRNVVVFTLIAFLILFIAAINYVNLATARASRRGTEVGVRKSLGAMKSQLVNQFYVESGILTLISVGLALVLVELFKDPFSELMNLQVASGLFADSSTWILLIAIAGITTALAGSYPAFLLSSFKPARVLKGTFGTEGSAGGFRKGLVVSQFSLSIILILCTVIIFRQTDFMLAKDLGFDREQIIVLPIGNSETAAAQDLLKNEILRQPGVAGATYMSNLPGKAFAEYGSRHSPAHETITTAAGAADADVIETLGIKLLAGSGFPNNPAYSTENGNFYLINETLAGGYGWNPEEAIGKPFVIGNREGEIVGVMRDFNYQSLREEVQPLALFLDKEMANYLVVKLTSINIRGTLSALEQVWQEMTLQHPFEVKFLDQQINALYQSDVQTRYILLLFSGLAIFIACMGATGLSSFMIQRRAKEIGIRKVMGASVGSIITLLNKDFLKLVLMGFIIAIPIAWYAMNRWLEDFAYRIEIGAGVFLLAGLFAVLMAVITVSAQSIRAALMNPVKSLRSE